MKELVGDIPAYLVFLISSLCALLGVTFFGAHFLLLKAPPPTVTPPCSETVEHDDSSIQKWLAWSRIALMGAFSNSDLIWNGLGKFLSIIPSWLIFYGFSIILMMVIPVMIFPLSVILALYGSFQTCATFKDKYVYSLPPLYFSQLCTEKWDWRGMSVTDKYLTIFTSWIPHMLYHIIECIVLMMGNIIVWNISAMLNTFVIIYGLFIKPFFNMPEIFKKMDEYSSSMSAIILFIVLYGSFKYLSPYVFIGFCIASIFIFSKAIIAELLKKD